MNPETVKKNATGSVGAPLTSLTASGGVSNSTPKEEEPTTKSIEVDRDLLERILDRQESMEAELKEKDEQIKKLLYAADVGRIGLYEAKNSRGELIRTFGVAFYPEVNKEKGETVLKIVRGTKLIHQDVAVEDNGGVRRVVEVQTIRVFLDNGEGKPFKEVDMPYLSFYRNIVRKRFPVVKESRDDNGDYRTLRMEDGREIEFDIKFLNL